MTVREFFSSFEVGDPLPSWDAPTADVHRRGDGMRGMLRVDAGPPRAVAAKPHVGFTGHRALCYTGRHESTGRAFRAGTVFDVAVTVEPDTELSYAVFPEYTPGDESYPATWVAVDLAFADGGYLSDLAVRDQHGAVLTPHGQGASRTLSVDQWNLKRVPLGEVAAGRTVTAILLSYDKPSGPAEFRGWIDDIRIGPRRAPRRRGPSDYVITTRGTHSSGTFSRGNTIPATAVPHGFNFWTPVTDAGTLAWLYEYHRANNGDNRPEIQAFALSHQPSPWMGDRQTFQVMPSDRPGRPDAGRRSRALAFDHAHELARPYLYSVRFDTGLTTEIAPTDHAAMFRFTFTGPTGTLLFDNVDGNAALTIDPAAGVVTGYTDVRSALSNGASRMFVYATFDRPVVDSGRPAGVGARRDASGYARFDTATDRTVTMRIATSLISVEQARANLALEIAPTDTFDDIAERARRLWDDTLSVIEVEGASEDQLVTLYSNLYRLFLYPNSAYENVGTAEEPRYVHAVQSSSTTPASSPTHSGAAVVPGKVYVNNGFWDTYRTTWPAYALLAPDRAGELLDGFLQHYRDSGWMSRWSSPGYADLMVGTSSDVVVADLAGKGIGGFDVELAYESALKNATVQPPDNHVGRKGLDRALFCGYTPAESTAEALSWALDGYINDFGIAMLAGLLAQRVPESDPRHDRYRAEEVYFRQRALGYVHLFDRAVGFFQGRHADGRWRLSPEEFDPRVWGFDYTETNAWNMAFHAPHDGRGLANLYGGPAGLAAKLDAFFATPETGEAAFKGSYRTVIHEMTEARDVRMGMYGHSNQPAHHIAYMYLHAGEPWKTQAVVREVLARLYLGSEIGQGYCGDEDNGEMSAWHVFSALGFYPLAMGSPTYAIGSPLFTKATIHLPNGNDLVISAPDNGPDAIYVQGVTIDGEPYDRTYLPHDLLAKGGVVEFAMGPRPSTWGTGAENAPPSLTADAFVPAPLADVTGPGRGTPVASADIDADPGVLFDDQASTGAVFTSSRPWVAYHLRQPARVELYTVTSSADEGDPDGWVLEGSRDGERWEVLDTRTAEPFQWRRQTRPFRVARPGTYRSYRLTFSGRDDRPLRLAEIELLAAPSAPGMSAGS